MIHHPDKGGDTCTMQEINAEFDALFEELKKAQNEAHEEQKESGFKYSAATKSDYIPYVHDAPEEFRARLVALLIAGLSPELCGSWIWCYAPKSKKELMKNLDFLYHSGKQMWYYRPVSCKWHGESNTPIDKIRKAYGSQRFTVKQQTKQEIMVQ